MLPPGDEPETLLDALSHPSRPGVKPGLERMQRLMGALGNPEAGLRVVLVGGTSGKGSTATMIARILETAGLRVGLHTKPHLHRVEERFVVDGRPVAPADLAALIRDAAPAALAAQPSWFELTAALALLAFRRAAVDVAVVEVGLGGALDATNVVCPRVAVLTNVGLDHTDVLGDTVEQIAADKVGIVKPGCVAVSGATQPSVRTIVDAHCRAVGVPLWLLGRDVQSTGSTTRFAVQGPGFAYDGLEIRLLGDHQLQNAALAVAAVQALAHAGIVAPEAAVRQALAAVQVPGRMEVFPGPPRIILDGAHNPDKMAALAEALRRTFPQGRLLAVVAFKQGHDYRASLAHLTPLLDRAILTRFSALTDYGRNVSQPPADLALALAELGVAAPLATVDDPVQAMELAIASADPADLIVVTGSLYLVGAVRAWLLGQ